MKTRVVHVGDHVLGAVYIGRPMPRQGLKGSKLQNPYRMGPVEKKNVPLLVRRERRREVVSRYRAWLLGPGRRLLADLPALRGKPIACWCRHDGEAKTEDNLCHGDVIIALLDIFTDEDLRRMADEEFQTIHA